jgi:hypothetical protein
MTGVDYPKPMVNHAFVSKINMERMKQVYTQLGQYRQTGQVLLAERIREDGNTGSVPDPWHSGVDPDRRIHAMDPDSDPYPAIFVIDLQDANKKLI